MTTLRIPTKHQYAFIEVQYEGNDIKGEYDRLYHEFNSEGTSEYDFSQIVTTIVDSNFEKWGSTDDYAMLNDSQKKVIQSLKRYFKRINDK